MVRVSLALVRDHRLNISIAVVDPGEHAGHVPPWQWVKLRSKIDCSIRNQSAYALLEKLGKLCVYMHEYLILQIFLLSEHPSPH